MSMIAMEIILAATATLVVTRALAALAKGASRRHVVRLGGFVALLLLPAFVALLPSGMVLRSAAPAAIAPAATQEMPYGAWILAGLIVLWACGVLALLIRAGAGMVALRALWGRSRPHDFDAARLACWRTRAGFGNGWSLRVSSKTEAPISWGIVRPIVLLPESSADWGAAQLDAAMLHELAHLRRRDSLTQALALFVCALYWPHPLVWLEAQALKADAEKAADDAVLLSGMKPSDYADLLLRVAVARGRHLAFSMAQRQGLEARIQSILTPNRALSGVTKMQVFNTAATAAVAALLLAVMRPGFADAAAGPALAQNEVTPPTAETSSVAQTQLPAPSATTSPARSTERRGISRRRIRKPAIADQQTTLADAHIGESVAKALADAHLNETVAKAVADAHIGEIVSKALADAHIDEKIAAAMKAAQPAIDAAVARAQRRAQQALPSEQQAAPSVP